MAKPGQNPARLNLTRRFTMLFMLTIGVISVLSGLILTRFQAENMLRRDAVVTKEFVQSIIAEADRVHSLKPSSSETPAIEHFLRRDPTESTKRLDDLFRLVGAMPDVIRVNVFEPDGTVAWSTDHRLVGMLFPTNHDLEEALAGELVVEMGEPTNAKAEYAFLAEGTHFVETYVPLWDMNNVCAAVTN